MPRVDAVEAAGALMLLASAAALAFGSVAPVPWLGAPVLLAGLLLWRRLRDRIAPAFRLPWLLVVLGAAFGAADLVGVGFYVLPASLAVGALLALAQAADRRFAPG